MSQPTPRFIRYDRDRRARWKIVPAKYVVMIANRSTKGADWTGCPKNHILDEFERVEEHGHVVDRERFGELMDKAVKAAKKVRKFEEETMGEIFKQPPT